MPLATPLTQHPAHEDELVAALPVGPASRALPDLGEVGTATLLVAKEVVGLGPHVVVAKCCAPVLVGAAVELGGGVGVRPHLGPEKSVHACQKHQ